MRWVQPPSVCPPIIDYMQGWQCMRWVPSACPPIIDYVQGWWCMRWVLPPSVCPPIFDYVQGWQCIRWVPSACPPIIDYVQEWWCMRWVLPPSACPPIIDYVQGWQCMLWVQPPSACPPIIDQVQEWWCMQWVQPPSACPPIIDYVQGWQCMRWVQPPSAHLLLTMCRSGGACGGCCLPLPAHHSEKVKPSFCAHLLLMLCNVQAQWCMQWVQPPSAHLILMLCRRGGACGGCSLPLPAHLSAAVRLHPLPAHCQGWTAAVYKLIIQIEHSLPLTKLTNLSSEWKVG